MNESAEDEWAKGDPGCCTRRSYGQVEARAQYPWTDQGLVGVFAATAAGAAVAWRVPDAVLAVTVLGGVVGLRRGLVQPTARLAVAMALWLLAGSWAADDRRAMEAAPLGPWRGLATLRSDPDARGSGVYTVVEIDGFRYEARAWGSPARAMARRLAGEQMVMVGERRAVDGSRGRRLATRHIVGGFDVEVATGAGPGSAATRAANRVHRAVEAVAAPWEHDRRALLSGLVLGRDSNLSPQAVEAFRTAGLSHLTAVSGQNVALLVAMMAPIVASARRLTRWSLTVTVIAWFAVLTRFEPSVLRASAMALLAVTATALGRDRRPVRLLALAGTALILVDPLLVRSVSFWLSMSATTGLLVAAPALRRVLDSTPGTAGGMRRVIATALVTTAGAQLGVLGVTTAFFGVPSSVSLLTNLVAVPLASLVMMSGPALAVLGAVAPQSAPWLAAPVGWAVQGIHAVARLGQQWAPPRPVDLVVWAMVIAVTIAGGWWRLRGR